MNGNEIIIYTDGCSLGNPGKGGWAAVLISKSKRKEIYGGFSYTTNNRMEILAVIKALESIQTKFSYNINIYSDSKLLIDSVNKRWIYSWSKNGWKKSDKKPVLNSDLWKRLISLLNQHNFKFNWVPGHSGIKENERCDVLSKLAAESGNYEEDTFYLESKDEDSSVLSLI